MNKINKAVIVAAGRSSRLYPLTLNTPKGLLEISGEPMLCRSVRLLQERGINDILVVVGYLRQMIEDALKGQASFKFNPFFAETNNMGSLWFAREWVNNEPFIYLHSDIVYAPELLDSLLSTTSDDTTLLVDTGPTDEESMKVRVVDGRFTESNKEIAMEEAYGEWIGATIFSRPKVLFSKIEALLERREFMCYDTLAFTEMAAEGSTFDIIPTDGYPWIEIDDNADLENARNLFP